MLIAADRGSRRVSAPRTGWPRHRRALRHSGDVPRLPATGEEGFITAELLRRHLPPPFAEHEYFICGPNVMMDAIEQVLSEMKVPLFKYHSERYSFV